MPVLIRRRNGSLRDALEQLIEQLVGLSGESFQHYLHPVRQALVNISSATARQTLALLVDRIRATHSVADLANLLCREVDLALHPESVALMSLEPRSGMLVDPKLRGRVATW